MKQQLESETFVVYACVICFVLAVDWAVHVFFIRCVRVCIFVSVRTEARSCILLVQLPAISIHCARPKKMGIASFLTPLGCSNHFLGEQTMQVI
jgi:hypothetical protein